MRLIAWTAGLSLALASPLAAQAPDSLATLRVRAVRDSAPVAGARVTSDRRVTETDHLGVAILRLAPGRALVTIAQIGFTPDTLVLTLRAGQDTTVTADLASQALELESVVVTATRSERRVEDTPLRVEVVDEEEVAEKVAMTPGDIAMLLNETSGLRVQTTSPSLGGANVRVQGLRGRYTLILADGLPLYGGQAGGLGLLQIPPLDLGRVEVIKGAASALYGSSALGGVVNLVSRRPGETGDRELLVNQTTRNGTDGVLFLGGPIGKPGTRWGGTFLTSAHRQAANDLDGDGWADMAGYSRVVVRPRAFYGTNGGLTAFATLGYTFEDREGGTLPGRLAPDGAPFLEGLRTHRADGGISGRVVLPGGAVLAVRGSVVEQRHEHQFGAVREEDVHRTAFLETSVAVTRRVATYVVGAAYQAEHYANAVVPEFDYAVRIPAIFAQADVEASRAVVLSGSGRVDWHSRYRVIVSPRVSALLRTTGVSGTAWSARLSVGAGTFAPVPFTEETEATGLTPLRPLQNLAVERAVSAALDLNGSFEGSLGRVELNVTGFASRIRQPIAEVTDTGTTVGGASFLALRNAPVATETWGGELIARLVRGIARVTAYYTHLRATEWDPEAGGTARRPVPLAPRHAVGVVGSIEQEGTSRLGLELYFTGRQPLDENPYRNVSESYLVIGILAERVFPTRLGRARVFLNAENVGNVRQTHFDPLVLPVRGRGGRWTVDSWTEASGFVLNGGIRLAR